MVDVTDLGDRIEERKDLGSGDKALYAYWQAQEAIAEKEERKWIKQGREIVKRYRDERPESIQSTHRFNILWSNVQTLIPTLYGRTPKPDVERRFKDADPSGRLASILMERCLSYSLDAFDFDDMMESVVEDRLLPGRGSARVLYIPHFGDEIKEEDKQEKQGEQPREFENAEADASAVASESDEDEGDGQQPKLREVVYEEVVGDYVFWEDYREGPARKWREVPWVRYRAYLSRDQLVSRFGKGKGRKVNLDYTPKGSPAESVKDEPPPDLYKKAIVHEVWDKTRLEVIWYAPGTPDLILDKRADPLRLPDFFPGPSPLRSTSTNDKRVPVADYIEYQDQARELDRLTARIDKLTQALKVAGVYAGDEKQTLQQLLDEGTENRLIPVGDMQSWADKGGMKGVIEWLPIEQVAQTLIALHSARDKVKALLYELTGIGDIMRGMTEPDETAAAQKLKANFSTRRVTPQQKKVAKFARNFLRLMGGIVAEHFAPKTISMITGYPQLDPVPPVPPRPIQPLPPAPQLAGLAQPAPPPRPQLQAYQQQLAQWQQASAQAQQVTQANQQKQQAFDAAVQLMKRDGVHGFRIDIEADSTVAIDEAEDQENRVEFLRQFVPLMEQVVPLAQGNPALASLAKEMTLFAVRGFRVARPLEESITTAFDAIAKMPPPQPGGQGGPDSAADLAERRHETDTRAQIDQAKIQQGNQKLALQAAQMGQQAHDNAAKMAAQETESRMRMSLDEQKAADEAAFRRTRATNIESREASRLT